MRTLAAAFLFVAGTAFAAPPTVEELFQPARFGVMSISPDGKTIAALSPVTGGATSWSWMRRPRNPPPSRPSATATSWMRAG
jgi:hypothetical protein